MDLKVSSLSEGPQREFNLIKTFLSVDSLKILVILCILLKGTDSVPVFPRTREPGWDVSFFFPISLQGSHPLSILCSLPDSEMSTNALTWAEEYGKNFTNIWGQEGTGNTFYLLVKLSRYK